MYKCNLDLSIRSVRVETFDTQHSVIGASGGGSSGCWWGRDGSRSKNCVRDDEVVVVAQFINAEALLFHLASIVAHHARGRKVCFGEIQ